LKKSQLLYCSHSLFPLLYVSAIPVYASDNPKFTKHFNQSLFNITDKGLFSVEILLDDMEYPKLGKDVNRHRDT